MSASLISSVSEPLWYTSPQELDHNIAIESSSYSHEIAANGGFLSASFSIPSNRDDAESWIDGLGRHIEVYDETLALVWEGFVNEIEIVMGALTVKRGPLLEVDNKVNVKHQTRTYNTNPPIGGDSVETGFSSDTDSQDLYAIQENIITGGSISTTEGSELQGTYLAEFSFPQTGQELSLGGGGAGEISVKLECLGYVHFLKRYYYSQVVTASTINLSAKIEDVLGADPNSIFSTDYSNLTANALQVSDYEDGDTDAYNIIMSMVGLGDASDNRYVFGIYEDRIAYYSAIPTSYEYEHRLADQGMRVVDLDDNEVRPWNIRPGKWLFISDFLVGRTTESTLRLDPRMVLIESVRYTAPYSLSITGGKIDKFAQKLARFGLGIIA